MNRTKIEWCDYTWNPVTGCWGPGGTAEKPNWCPYCYAKKVADRFMADRVADKIRESQPQTGFMSPFYPVFYPERLSEPARAKKPSKIFVCSMADLFGDWVPRDWIEAVLNRTQRADYSHHTYQFLTKNPKRLKDFNPWPENCWVGTTVTCQDDMHRVLEMWNVLAKVRFVSFEPLLGSIDLGVSPAYIDWAIIGAMTGPGAIKPKPEWVRNLWEQYRAAGVPVFMKDNLKPIMGTLVREWPDIAGHKI